MRPFFSDFHPTCASYRPYFVFDYEISHFDLCAFVNWNRMKYLFLEKMQLLYIKSADNFRTVNAEMDKLKIYMEELQAIIKIDPICARFICLRILFLHTSVKYLWRRRTVFHDFLSEKPIFMNQ